MSRVRISLLLILVFFSPTTVLSCGFIGDVGSLEWTKRTGGALSLSEKFKFVLDGVAELVGAFMDSATDMSQEKINLADFAPPPSGIVSEAIGRLKRSSDPAIVNHSFRTAYWTLAVMKHAHPNLSPREIEEAWVAAILHDIGLAQPPTSGEFTLGGVKVVEELGKRYEWGQDSTKKVSEAITLNLNSCVDKDKYGPLAWAMNVGAAGETFSGPYRGFINGQNIIEIEKMYPRTGFYYHSETVFDAEIQRFPTQRFGLLKKIGFLKFRRQD